VKLRPVVPDELPDDIRRSGSVGVEVDAMPGGYVRSASMKGKIANADVREAVAGNLPLRKLFSKEQRDFLAAHAPEGIGLGELRVLGPIFVLKLRFEPPDYGRRLVAELWLLPDGSRIFELSTKCRPSEAFQVGVETRAYSRTSAWTCPRTSRRRRRPRSSSSPPNFAISREPTERGSQQIRKFPAAHIGCRPLAWRSSQWPRMALRPIRPKRQRAGSAALRTLADAG